MLSDWIFRVLEIAALISLGIVATCWMARLGVIELVPRRKEPEEGAE